MTARSKAVGFALEQLGKPALWGAKGKDPISGQVAFDCSGLATCAIFVAGGPNLTQVDNAQHLHDLTTPLPEGVEPEPGDLIFFGPDAQHIEHVALALAGGKAIDAAGATPRLPTIELAIQSGASVRVHDTLRYRGNFRGVHRNHFLDDIDAVCR